MNLVNTTPYKPADLAETDFSAQAVIDNDGNEMPITEAMILNACVNLEIEWSSVFTSKQTETP